MIRSSQVVVPLAMMIGITMIETMTSVQIVMTAMMMIVTVTA